MGSKRQRNFNLANWLVGLGFVALAASFALPWWTAPRTARIEGRADRISELLLEAATLLDLDVEDLDRPWAAALLEARTAVLVANASIPESAFVERPGRVEAYAGGLVFRGKHYEYFVVPGAISLAERRAGMVPPLEVYAYPAARLSSAQTAFFHSQIELSAFSRNLQANYRGEPVYLRPDRGAAVPREPLKEGAYRGRDDERWLVPAARPKPVEGGTPGQ